MSADELPLDSCAYTLLKKCQIQSPRFGGRGRQTSGSLARPPRHQDVALPTWKAAVIRAVLSWRGQAPAQAAC